MGKQALVIGGTGLLGKGITRELQHAGWQVDVLGRGNKTNGNKDARMIRADRSVPGAIKAALGHCSYELVVDCAAHNEEHMREAIDTFSERIGHYIYISTDFVYAADRRTTFPIREDAAVHRDTSYSAGKLDAELLLSEAWKRSWFPGTVLRPPHLLGAGTRAGCDAMLGRHKELLQIMAQPGKLLLIADGQLLIQPVWNREVGRCIAHLTGNEAAFGQTFNCAGADCVTTFQYYEIIAGLLDVPLTYTSVPLASVLDQKPETKHYVRHRMYDMSQLAALTRYKPQLTLQDALAETVEWMRDPDASG